MILRSHPTKLKPWTPLERVQQALRTNEHGTDAHASNQRPVRAPELGQGARASRVTRSCVDVRPKATRATARTHGQCFAAGLPAQSEPRNSVTLFSLRFSPPPHDNDNLSQILWLWEESHQLYVKTQSQCTWQTARQRRAAGRDISQFANNWIFYGFVKKLRVFHPF